MENVLLAVKQQKLIIKLLLINDESSYGYTFDLLDLALSCCEFKKVLFQFPILHTMNFIYSLNWPFNIDFFLSKKNNIY